MHYNAALRVRELTQNIFDIGDEIAQHIDNIAEAIADWDPELVTDCLHELSDIIAEGRSEVRPQLAELNGLRQAFISGVKAGRMSHPGSLTDAERFPHPGRTLSFMRADKGQVVGRPAVAGVSPGEDPVAGDAATQIAEPGTMASTAAWRLWMRQRSEALQQDFADLAEWVVDQTDRGLSNQSVLLTQAFARAERSALELVQQWQEVVDKQPTLARSMRGEAPPKFLQERDRVAAVVSRIQRKRRGAAV
ncbi:hypothetical protein [uncultured Corynebacterium sp.]|uniref:hypothetical protein n=1 Tax=uncultured Corynebacterium sp. TaxID=159447 RepID=UPI0025CECFEF|nr:hypothetical protein [uncultured Corynebacterium sp.]